MANRSLQIQRQGTEIAGHNLANVNNPDYARQRLQIASGVALPSEAGYVGTGVSPAGIARLRNAMVDRQIVVETSIRGSLEISQTSLQTAQAALGQLIDRQASGAEGAAALDGAGRQNGLAEHLGQLFNAFQSLASSPTSLAERQVLANKADSLANQFNQVSERLSNLDRSLNSELQSDTGKVNESLSQIARLNEQIAKAEMHQKGIANDLRDQRQKQLEELSNLIHFTSTTSSNGSLSIFIEGTEMVSFNQRLETLETFDSGNGRLQLRYSNSGTLLNPTAGRLHGILHTRDGALEDLRTRLNTLAESFITEVNTLHQAGFDLQGNTGELFFTGSNASDIAVNRLIVNDPSRIQASADRESTGNNAVALGLAGLVQKRLKILGNQTFAEHYHQTVTQLGQNLASTNDALTNQEIVESMLKRQRDSFSGVSIDEEMGDLIRYQKAFEASARLIVTIDEMLDTVINLKR